MNSKILCSTAFFCGMILFVNFAAQATLDTQKTSPIEVASAFTPAQKKELLDIIMMSIQDNPKVLKQSLEKYLAQEAQEQEKKEKELAQKRIQENKKELFENTTAPLIGVKEAQKKLVLFIDPYCGYCRKSLEDLDRLVLENKNIHVSIRNLAILGEASEWAVKALIAAQKQGKYDVFQTALKKTNQPLEKAQLIDLAETLGLDVALFKLQLEQADVKQEYEKNMALAAALGIAATPTLIIEGNMIQGYIPFAQVRAQMKLPLAPESKTSEKPAADASKKS